MKNKKILIILTIIIIILGGVGYCIYEKISKNKYQEEIIEYVPEEEITASQLRKTIVSLYFNQKDTNTLVPEPRSIDVKQLTKDPYNTLMQLLIKGPQNEKLEKLIPEGTKVNKIELKDGILQIDLSKEFIDNHKEGVEAQSRTIYSIVNTVSCLNEVEAVKIIIDGKEDACFKDSKLNLKEPFIKQDTPT